MAGIIVEAKPGSSQLHPLRAPSSHLSPRLQLGMNQLLDFPWLGPRPGSQPLAELLWLGASTSSLNVIESQWPQVFIPAMLTHASVAGDSLCTLCTCLLSECKCVVPVSVCLLSACTCVVCVCVTSVHVSLVSMHMCHLLVCLSSPCMCIIFLTALLRCSSHSMQFTHLSCTIQWIFTMYSELCNFYHIQY